VLLILLSVFFYLVHYAVFRDVRHIFIYLIGDIAFVFVQVLLVTLIIEQLLAEREKRTLMKKLNMVIGVFFSEAGTPLLKCFNSFDSGNDKISQHLILDANWTSRHFVEVQEILNKRDYKIDFHKGSLAELKEFIVSKRGFLLRLLENQNLLEHENFTELLWAVFHLAEELSHRKTVEGLPEKDYEHLVGDMKRVYKLLVREWLIYMEHLKDNYPYLFSLAMRTNPFDANAAVELK
jgi:hypothetical protein